MKLENQVCSLELAKKLKELGVKHEALFYYSKPYKIHVYSVFRNVQTYSLAAHTDSPPIAAFTVAELGEMLPPITGRGYISTTRFKDKDWHCEFLVSTMNTQKLEVGDTEADARARMLVYIIENKLIEL